MWQKGLLKGKISFFYAEQIFQPGYPETPWEKGSMLLMQASCCGRLPLDNMVIFQLEIHLLPGAGC